MATSQSLIKVFLLCSTLVLSNILSVSAKCTAESYFSPYDNIENVVVKRPSDAKDSIKCSLYGITNRRITETLINKKVAGLDVTICLDKTQSAGRSSTHKELENGGIEIVIKKDSVLEHNKFCVIDNSIVIIGSWNSPGAHRSRITRRSTYPGAATS